MWRWLAVAIVGSIAWSALVFWSLLEGWTRDAIAPVDEPRAFMGAIEDYIAAEDGNIALILIEQGVEYARYYQGPVGANTLFPLASLSKWFTALGVMALVEDDRIDLDAPVEDYITRWSLPGSSFDNQQVTIRRLLGHTAGLTDDLGFGDYSQDEALPTLVESLNEPRSGSGNQRTIIVGQEPGSDWAYSGGGYLILELMVEEINGTTFDAFMESTLFAPLDLTRTTYDPLFLHEDVAPPETASGETAQHYQYASKAATALASTPNDLAKVVLAIINRQFPVEHTTLATMRRPEGWAMGAPIWGLGTILHAPNDSGTYVYGHAGSNEPAINTEIRINPDSGDALIVLATGNPSMATRVGFLWTFWQTGRPDFIGFPSEMQRVAPFYVAGIVTILLGAIGGAVLLRTRSGDLSKT